MTVPDDSKDVMNALRFGWALAELNGRSRPGGPRPRTAGLPERNGHSLPLRMERTPMELLLEVKGILLALGQALGIGQPAANNQAGICALINEDIALVVREEAAPSLANHLYELDAHAQDVLAAQSQTQSCAYQLGRGLAECFWQLDPEAAPGTDNAWDFLLGDGRTDELSRLAGRLSAYFDPVAIPSVAGTLEIWRAVAADEHWRGDAEARDRLYLQVRRWYELLVIEQAPSTFITAAAKQPFRSQLRTAGTAARALWAQLVLLGAATALIVLAITLTADGSTNPAVKSALWALGVLGVSASTVQTRLKSQAQNLFQRLASAVNTDLVIVSITTAPPPPGKTQLPPGTVTTIARRRRIDPHTDGVSATSGRGLVLIR